MAPEVAGSIPVSHPPPSSILATQPGDVHVPRVFVTRRVGVVPLLLLLGAAACEGPFEPPTGSLELRVTTVGVDLDADGYAFSVDSGASQPIAVNAVDSIPGLGIGQHNVTLSGLAINCALGGSPSRTVDVRTGSPAVVTFSVLCNPLVGSVHATTATSGMDLDPDGYSLTVDGGSTHPIASTGSLDLPNLSVATHQLTLSGVAGNCVVGQPNPRSASVSYATTTTVAFVVTCNASTGAVQVTTTTTGTDVDPDGYSAIVDSASGSVVATNGTVTISGLSPGAHSIALTAVAPNCTVTPPNPRAVTVTVGATTPVAFDIACTATNGTLRVITSTTGTSLDHDGYTVLVDEFCDYYYGCYYGWSEPAAVNDTVMIAPIPNGGHTVWLANVAANCAVAGANPVTATVVAGDTTTVVFAVTCAPAGSVAVTAVTTGVDLDAGGYTVQVDSGPSALLPTNGVATIRDVPEGDHAVQLGAVDQNCSVQGSNPVTIHVTANDTARTTFQINCVSIHGTLRITVATSGANIDPNGYTVTVDYSCDDYYGCYYLWSEVVAVNDTITIPNVLVGNHTVELMDVAQNCAVQGANPVIATVLSGATTTVALQVACVVR